MTVIDGLVGCSGGTVSVLVLELAAEATRTRRVDISCRMSIVSRAAFLLSSTAGFEEGAGGILIVFVRSDSGVDLDGLGAVVCGCCWCWLGILAVAKEQCITFEVRQHERAR